MGRSSPEPDDLLQITSQRNTLVADAAILTLTQLLILSIEIDKYYIIVNWNWNKIKFWKKANYILSSFVQYCLMRMGFVLTQWFPWIRHCMPLTNGNLHHKDHIDSLDGASFYSVDPRGRVAPTEVATIFVYTSACLSVCLSVDDFMSDWLSCPIYSRKSSHMVASRPLWRSFPCMTLNFYLWPWPSNMAYTLSMWTSKSKLI